MKDGPTAGGPGDDGNAKIRTNKDVDRSGRNLVATNGNRWLLPGVESDDGLREFTGLQGTEQSGVNLHVPDAGQTSIYDDSPVFHVLEFSEATAFP